jgi:hypothetical protein
MREATRENLVVLEVFGEGKTDIGKDSVTPQLPNQGVVNIVVHRLCGNPAEMRVKTKRYAHLQQGKGLWQKVRFAKRQARYNKGTRGVVFVLDTEGDNEVIAKLAKGRDHELPEFPLAIGVAQPCIESWLLVDPSALCQALGLPGSPELPENPESLPAPAHDRKHNPKIVLAELGANSQHKKDAIARTLDLNTGRKRCPFGFEPFAAEIETLIRPLFT